MYLSTKFYTVWRTSDSETDISPKKLTDKDFEKANIKIVISM